MDHLHGNIKNIANRKTALPPLFGALSFCTVTKDQIYQGDDGESTFRRCRVVTVTAGALTHPEHIFQGANPAGRRMELPVGLFEFQAFEHKVCFSELVLILRHWLVTTTLWLRPTKKQSFATLPVNKTWTKRRSSTNISVA